MLGLPQTTEVKKIIPKRALYSKFELNTAEQKEFDAAIRQMTIVNEISLRTIPALQKQEKAVFVLAVQLKQEGCAERLLQRLCRLIDQRLLLALCYEGKLEHAIDFDMLKQELSDHVVDGLQERYQFTWPDKRKAILAANAPINKTLRPCREESVDFDNTENLYIEGDNLEVLKLLQETYLGKVKMIYIDPPYNTGNDFVYEDDFKQSAEEYIDNSGQLDEEGNRMVTNTESNGRFHTDWLNMMYPRLKLAKDLLDKNEGVIFISIDESEHSNLKKICDEIFGEDNFIAELVWAAGRKNDSKHISISHEYILAYFKNSSYIYENKVVWRERKQGLDDIYSEYEILKRQFGSDIKSIEKNLKDWYRLYLMFILQRIIHITVE